MSVPGIPGEHRRLFEVLTQRMFARPPRVLDMSDIDRAVQADREADRQAAAAAARADRAQAPRPRVDVRA